MTKRNSLALSGATSTIPFELRSASEDGRIEGYISIFGQEDSYRTKFMPGCFTRSIEAIKSSGKRLKMLFNHDSDKIIGAWDELREDDTGLFGVGQITQRTELGRDITGLVQDNLLDGISQQFRRKAYNAELREFTEVELVEASLVTFESCPGANLRSEADYSQEEFVEILTRDTGLSGEQVLGILSGENRAPAPQSSLAAAMISEIKSAF